MNPAQPLPTGTANISIVVILLVFIFFEYKLKGMQWVGFLLGGWLNAAAPPGSMIDDLWVSTLGVFQSLVVKGLQLLGDLATG